MPVSDICTPPHQTVYYAYKNWPKKIWRKQAIERVVEAFA
jgi:hypothetical protein